jgi:hypothetical protein
MSASCFSESTFETLISPAVTNSRTKKCLIRICFVLRWNSGFWASRIAASLSICNVGVAFNWSSSVKILLIPDDLPGSFAGSYNFSFSCGYGNGRLSLAHPGNRGPRVEAQYTRGRAPRAKVTTMICIAVAFKNPLCLVVLVKKPHSSLYLSGTAKSS